MIKLNPLGNTNKESITHNEMIEIKEAPGVFLDALICDQLNQCVFMSLWGQSSAIQHFIARITLEEITLINVNNKVISVNKQMTKVSGKLPVNEYGTIIHCFMTRNHSKNSKSKDVLYEKQESHSIYDELKTLSSIPLMDQWENMIMDSFKNNDIVSELITVVGSVRGAYINLNDQDMIEKLVSEIVKNNYYQ